MNPRPILICYDGSENSKQAVTRAADLFPDQPAIVVGQRGIGGAERTLLGSVSTAVVHHADRPVVVVPAERAADC